MCAKRRAKFLGQFISRPGEVGATGPTSRSVACAILDQVDWGRARRIAEFGAGDGAVTVGILERMRDAYLTAFEINPSYIRDLQVIAKKYDRLTLRTEGVDNLDFPVDVVISSVPRNAFSGNGTVSPTLDNLVAHLDSDGRFVHQSFRRHVEPLLEAYFSEIGYHKKGHRHIYNCSRPVRRVA